MFVELKTSPSLVILHLLFTQAEIPPFLSTAVLFAVLLSSRLWAAGGEWGFPTLKRLNKGTRRNADWQATCGRGVSQNKVFKRQVARGVPDPRKSVLDTDRSHPSARA